MTKPSKHAGSSMPAGRALIILCVAAAALALTARVLRTTQTPVAQAPPAMCPSQCGPPGTLNCPPGQGEMCGGTCGDPACCQCDPIGANCDGLCEPNFDLNGEPDSCPQDCVHVVCGDGEIEYPEQCDSAATPNGCPTGQDCTQNCSVCAGEAHCIAAGDSCTDDSQCCQPATCAISAPPPLPCAEDGDSCSNNSDCCVGLICAADDTCVTPAYDCPDIIVPHEIMFNTPHYLPIPTSPADSGCDSFEICFDSCMEEDSDGDGSPDLCKCDQPMCAAGESCHFVPGLGELAWCGICANLCGNGVVDPGEYCDPNGTEPDMCPPSAAGDTCINNCSLCFFPSGGICTPTCVPTGGVCTSPGQCCGGSCYGGICMLPPNPQPSYIISVDDGRTTIQPGEPTTYIIQVMNVSAVPPTTPIQVAFAVPVQLDLNMASVIASGGSYSLPGIVTWYGVMLAPGSSIVFAIGGSIHPSAPAGIITAIAQIIGGPAASKNTGILASSSSTSSVSSFNSTSSRTSSTSSRTSSTSSASSSSSPPPVSSSSSDSFSSSSFASSAAPSGCLTIQKKTLNSGGAWVAATAGFGFKVTHLASGFAQNAFNTALGYVTIGNLTPGTYAVKELPFSGWQSVGPSVQTANVAFGANCATVTFKNKPNPGAPALGITITDYRGAITIPPAQPLNYDIVVTNMSAIPASGVVVRTDPLHPSLLSPIVVGGSYNNATRVASWAIPFMAPSGSVTLRLQTAVGAATADGTQIDARATIVSIGGVSTGAPFATDSTEVNVISTPLTGCIRIIKKTFDDTCELFQLPAATATQMCVPISPVPKAWFILNGNMSPIYSTNAYGYAVVSGLPPDEYVITELFPPGVTPGIAQVYQNPVNPVSVSDGECTDVRVINMIAPLPHSSSSSIHSSSPNSSSPSSNSSLSSDSSSSSDFSSSSASSSESSDFSSDSSSSSENSDSSEPAGAKENLYCDRRLIQAPSAEGYGIQCWLRDKNSTAQNPEDGTVFFTPEFYSTEPLDAAGALPHGNTIPNPLPNPFTLKCEDRCWKAMNRGTCCIDPDLLASADDQCMVMTVEECEEIGVVLGFADYHSDFCYAAAEMACDITP